MTYKIAVVILLFACCAGANPQGQNGKIVFWRESQFLDADYKPPLFCDGFELGRMKSGGYMEVVAQPGRHECVAESAQGPETTIEVEPGGVAYERIVITPTVKRHAVLTTSDEAEYGKQKKLARISTGELDSVQPLVANGLAPPAARANPDSQESSATNAEPEIIYKPGANGVGYPRCVYCPDPKYTPQARAAKLEGTVELNAIIGADGTGRNIEVVKGIGKGLDDQAVLAIQRWRFQPAGGPNGDPVPVAVPIQITFRLLK